LQQIVLAHGWLKINKLHIPHWQEPVPPRLDAAEELYDQIITSLAPHFTRKKKAKLHREAMI